MTEFEIREAVMIAVGQASMCWNPRPSTEVFDSEQARVVGEELMAKLKPVIEDAWKYRDLSK